MNGQTHSLWCFTNADATYYFIDLGRGTAGLKKLFKTAYDGDPSGQRAGGVHVPAGGVEFDSEQKLSGCVLASEAFAVGCPEGDHGVGSQVGGIFYGVLRYGLAYQKRSESEFEAEHRNHQEKALRRRAKAMGYELVPKGSGESLGGEPEVVVSPT